MELSEVCGDAGKGAIEILSRTWLTTFVPTGSRQRLHRNRRNFTCTCRSLGRIVVLLDAIQVLTSNSWNSADVVVEECLCRLRESLPQTVHEFGIGEDISEPAGHIREAFVVVKLILTFLDPYGRDGIVTEQVVRC